MSLNTPVLLLIFNRPEHTRKVFQQIRRFRPAQLYISADGPRPGHSTDAENCRQTRDIIREIDWDCAVQTLFRAENLGCKNAVRTGIDWFFEHVEAGIILEDDCLPDESFFRFCTEMLDRYKSDESVMHISGSNPAPEVCRGLNSSYLFSRFPFIWGWATWRRAWLHYDGRLQDLEAAWSDPNSAFSTLLSDRTARRYLLDKFRKSRDGELDTWDYAWFYSIIQCRGLCVTPIINLVQNIGFDQSATHTRGGIFRRRRQSQSFIADKLIAPGQKQPVPAIEKAFFLASQKGNPGLLLRRLFPGLFFKPRQAFF